MKVRLLAVSLIGAMAGLTSCSSPDSETTLLVEATLNLCAEAGSCVSLPAAGATYSVYRNSTVIAEGVVGDSGTEKITVEPGNYAAEISIPDLGLYMATPVGSLPAIDVSEGDAGELQVVLNGTLADVVTPDAG